MEEEYLTIDEVARKLRVHRKTIARWVLEGKLSYWQLGNSRTIRIPASALNRYIHHPFKEQKGA
jgi:excisionase family DNA binding protein